ncbi:hypothetical protein [Clostridium sporogenes]
MKITVINGTEIKGCTYNIKENFLEILREGNEITEFICQKICLIFAVDVKIVSLKVSSLALTQSMLCLFGMLF